MRSRIFRTEQKLISSSIITSDCIYFIYDHIFDINAKNRNHEDNALLLTAGQRIVLFDSLEKAWSVCYYIEVGEIMNNEHGSIRINDEVIALCAVRAALGTQGVFALAPAVFTDTISKSILGKSSDTRGVRISRNDDELRIDLYIIVGYGVKIPSVAWNIQENVKREIEGLSGLSVSSVNIHVQGIHFIDKKPAKKAERRTDINERKKS